MDIVKYIGQYLLKNNYCYIHGIGNMELVKKSASYDNGSLQGPTYDVIVTSGGSIDDSLANFIATNEQISISKAANALRDFSIQSRKDMALGKDVEVPGIGKFIEENGRVKFITASNFSFTPQGLPVLKNSKQLEEQKVVAKHVPSTPVETPSNINWTAIFTVIILLVLVGAGIFGFMYYKKQNSGENAVVVKKDTPVVQAPPPPPPPIDTTHKKDTVVAPPPVDTNAINEYKVIVTDTAKRRDAESRIRKFKINGWKPELLTKDSVTFTVLLPVKCRIVDTTKMLDSLRRYYGIKGGRLYH